MPRQLPGRRTFLIRSAAATAALSSFGLRVGRGVANGGESPATTGLALTDTSVSPHVLVRDVNLTDVIWTRGFWADKFRVCRERMVPNLWEVMKGTDRSQFYQNFLIAAGLEKGRHRGPGWNDGDFYKSLEAASAVYAVTKDEDLGRNIDEAIRTIGLAQRGDGYLHTPVLIKVRNGDTNARPFEDKLDFEAYNFGHLMTAACVHQRATGKPDLLRIAVKAADYLVDSFRSQPDLLARSAICPAHYMGLVELYRATRDSRYLDLARKLIDLRGTYEGGTDDNQDRIPFRRQTQAIGHAVRANYLYAGSADVYAETGDQTLLEPLLKIWDDLTSRKMSVTGACGALFDGASPDGSKDQKSITRVHQAYGRDYQLPNSTAHNETCASLGNAFWNRRMLQITGEARFADVLELVLYNAALAGISLDGTRFFYTNTLRQLDQMPVELRWSRQREAFISCMCCPPNLVRTIAEVGAYAYGLSDDRLWVHLYGGNTLDTELSGGGRLRLTQETDYPWDGRVTIKLGTAPDRTCSLMLRIPGWARGATLSLNGVPVDRRPVPGTYAELRRKWSAGDVVELVMPMPARLLQAHPLVEEARNQVAIQRGPIVYCLESADLPKGVRVQDVVIPSGIEWKPRYDPDLLGGVTVLEGRARACHEAEWSRELYRDLAPADSSEVDVTLIPYFAWDNRGRSEMTVWMPLGR